MKCPVCHSQLRHNETSCPNCGMVIKKNVSCKTNNTPDLSNIYNLKNELQKIKAIPSYKPRYGKGSLKMIIFTSLLFGVWGLIFIMMVLRNYF